MIRRAPHHMLIAALGALALMLAAAGSQAAVDVSIDKEFERLDALRTLLQDIEAANSEEDLALLRERWSALQARLETVKEAPDNVRSREIRTLDEALMALTDDVERLRDEVTRYFPKARNRVAVFTLDDPDGLGIGDDLSYILAKQLLFSTRAQSYAVVNFQQGAAPQAPGELAYFDKVERLTRDQGYAMALWGRLARTRDGGVLVSLFGQAFPQFGDQPRFAYRVSLPTPRGEQWLTAELTHDRFKLAQFTLSSAFVERLPALAEGVRSLRASPRVRSEVVGTLTAEAPHYIANSRGDWVRMQVRGGASGWTSVRALCPRECRTLLDAVTFANEVVAAGDGRSPRPPADTLSADTQLVYEELAALNALSREKYDRVRAYAERSRATPRQNAGLANIAAVATIAEGLEETSSVDVPVLIAQADTLRDLSAYTAEANRNMRVIADAVPGEDAAGQAWKATTERRTLLTQRRWALILGIDRYDHLQPRKYARSDAERLAEVLSESGYRVKFLLNPDRREVERGLRAHTGDAQVVVYAAGYLRFVEDQASLLLPTYDPQNPRASDTVPLTVLATGGGERALILDGALSPALRDALPRDGHPLLVDFTGAETAPVEIGAGAFAYFLSRSLRGDQDAGGDGLIALESLAGRMNEEAARFGVPLQAKALSPGSGTTTRWLAAPRKSLATRSTLETEPTN